MDTTTKWQCDGCGEPILDARQGLFEYQSVKCEEVEGPRARGLRLFHVTRPDPRRPRKFGCQYDNDYYSSPRSEYTIRSILLTEMMGPEGLQFFLRLISVGELPTDEVLEMIRRVHVPGYEHARLHFEEAKDTDVIVNHDLDLLSQEAIERILGQASRFDDCELCPPSRP